MVDRTMRESKYKGFELINNYGVTNLWLFRFVFKKNIKYLNLSQTDTTFK